MKQTEYALAVKYFATLNLRNVSKARKSVFFDPPYEKEAMSQKV